MKRGRLRWTWASRGSFRLLSRGCARRLWSPRSGRSWRGRAGALLNWTVGLALALAISGSAGSAALAERRVALVIGNAKYDHAGVLANTINDANAIAALLTNAGFDFVDERTNLGVVEFKRAVREFVDRSANADVAVVYYSGHGLEVGGVNYLIPVDARLTSTLDVDDEAVSLDRLLVATERVKKLSLIILDACRENPFHPAGGEVRATRAVSMGLAGVTPTVADTLIAFAAKAGSVSYDGDGPNSPFTTALVKYIAQPGLDIRKALGKVRDEVLRETGNRQEPYVYGSLGGEDVALVPAKPAAPPRRPSRPPQSISMRRWTIAWPNASVRSRAGARSWPLIPAATSPSSLGRRSRKCSPPGRRARQSRQRPRPSADLRTAQPASGGTGRPAPAAPAPAAAALTPERNLQTRWRAPCAAARQPFSRGGSTFRDRTELRDSCGRNFCV